MKYTTSMVLIFVHVVTVAEGAAPWGNPVTMNTRGEIPCCLQGPDICSSLPGCFTSSRMNIIMNYGIWHSLGIWTVAHPIGNLISEPVITLLVRTFRTYKMSLLWEIAEFHFSLWISHKGNQRHQYVISNFKKCWADNIWH